MKDKSHVYLNKDGRMRIYDTITHSVTSYPRILMEEYLGRPLEPYEQVHHIDGDPLNNDINNLTIMNIGEHQRFHNNRKYEDKEVECYYCHKKFTWTALQQRYSNSNKHRHAHTAFCSRRCAGLYGREEQLRRNAQTECP